MQDEEGPKRSVTACILAIAVGVAPKPENHSDPLPKLPHHNFYPLTRKVTKIAYNAITAA